MKKFYLIILICLITGAIPTWGQNALDFDGTDDFVNCGQIDLPAFTVEAWIKPTSTLMDGAIVSLLNGSRVGYNFEIHLKYGQLVVTVNNGSSWFDITSASTLTVDSWTHIAVSCDGLKDYKIYINGVLDATRTTSANYLHEIATLFIGRRLNSGAQYYNGAIDELRIWNAPLSQTEIATNMGSELTSPASLPSLVAYYNFNQGVANGENASITSLIDLSAAQRNGSLSGFALTGTSSNWVTGISKYLYLTVSGATFPATAGTKQITVTSNTTWTVESDSPSWLTVTPASGTGNGTVTVTCASNSTSYETRAAVLTFTGTNTETKTLTFTQAAGVIITPAFTTSQNSFNASNNSITFTNTTSATGTTINSWSWDFGDGTNSTLQNPTHTFASNGTYKVKLTVSDGTQSSFIEKTVNVTDYILMNSCSVATILDEKNFYDSGNSTGSYSNNESYTLVFKPSTAGKYIQIVLNTIATEAGYDNLNIYDGENTSAPLLKNFNGNYTNQVVMATNTSGALCVVFTSDGSRTYSGWSATVREMSLSVHFTADKLFGINTLNVQFTDMSTATAKTWFWEFGDGSISNLQNPTHTYTATGVYSVKLTVSDGAKSQTLVRSNYIKVDDKIIMANGSVSIADDCNFYDSGGALANYSNSESYIYLFRPSTEGKFMQIDFSSIAIEKDYDFITIYDGETTSAPVLASFTGDYTSVKVTATNTSGALCVKFVSDNYESYSGWSAILRQVAFPVNFSADRTSGVAPLTVQFSNLSSATTTSWVWNFGDGTTSTDKNPAHTYTSGGIYSVTLTASDGTVSLSHTRTNYIIVDNYVLTMGNGTTVINNDLNFYDSGNSSNPYSNNENLVHVFRPSTPGKVVQIDFSSINVEDDYDYIYIYDGETATGTPIKTLTGIHSNVTVKATNATGALCVKFVSDDSFREAGWSAVVKQVPGLATAVGSTQPDQKCSVSPTLFTNQITVNIPNVQQGTYTLVGLSGTVAAKGNLSGDHTELQLPDIKPGIYLLTVEAGQTKQTFKVVKK